MAEKKSWVSLGAHATLFRVKLYIHLGLDAWERGQKKNLPIWVFFFTVMTRPSSDPIPQKITQKANPSDRTMEDNSKSPPIGKVFLFG